MIAVKNNAVRTTPATLAVGSTIVPFDALVCNTNSATSWSEADNAVVMAQAGRYNTECTVVISSTAGGNASLELLANGVEIAGDQVAATIEASGKVTLVLSVPILAEAAQGASAKLQWRITVSAASALNNAFASVQGIR